MPPTTQPQPIDQQALDLTHAIALQESGQDGTPNYNAVGDAGTSKGAYQWQPGNFEAAAKSAGLDPNDFSPENQDKVAYSEVKAYKDKGYDPGQIASLWNSGSPNNWQNHTGTTTINGKTVSYDTPAYVKGVQKYYQQITGSQGDSQSDTSGYQTQAALPPQDTQPKSQQDPGLLSDLSGDISTAASGAGTAISQAASGQINPLSGLLQSAGAVAGGITSGANDLLTHIPGVGGVIKGGENLLGQGIQSAANTDVGQQVVGAGENFAQAHPELAGDIGAAANIAGVVPVFEGAGLAKDAISGALTGAGKDALVDAISPEIKAGTKAGANDAAANGTVKSGLLGKVTRVPDPEMVEAAPVVKEVVPNFMKLSTNSEKLNAVQNGIGKLAEKLKSNLSSGEIQPVLTPEDLQTLQDGINTQIAQNPLLVGDAGKQAQQIFDQFRRFLPQEGDVTMSDVLDARKKLDNWISNIKGGSVFDPKTENAISVGLRAVRQGANDLIDQKVPEGNVKSLLRKQSLLYKVSDNLAPKASKEVGSTALTRLAGRHPGLLKAAKYAGSAAVSGLGLGEAERLLGGAPNQ